MVIDSTEARSAEEGERRVGRAATPGHPVAELVRVRNDERRRLARDLHDDAGQSLTALAVGLQALQTLDRSDEMRAHAAQLHEVALETLDSLSRLARGLHPLAPEAGICAAIERRIRDWPQDGIEVRLDAEEFDERGLGAALREALYRILLEALTNIRRHSHARHASIVLRRPGSFVEAIVTDDGQGCDVDAVLAGTPEDALGLRAMAERAAELGGAIDIDSHPGGGTRVTICLPIG